jgi:hypothetical protein
VDDRYMTYRSDGPVVGCGGMKPVETIGGALTTAGVTVISIGNIANIDSGILLP